METFYALYLEQVSIDWLTVQLQTALDSSINQSTALSETEFAALDGCPCHCSMRLENGSEQSLGDGTETWGGILPLNYTRLAAQ